MSPQIEITFGLQSSVENEKKLNKNLVKIYQFDKWDEIIFLVKYFFYCQHIFFHTYVILLVTRSCLYSSLTAIEKDSSAANSSEDLD